MQERYRMYQRNGGMFYAKDRKTGQRLSLDRPDPKEEPWHKVFQSKYQF